MGQFSALGVFRAAAYQMLAGVTDIVSRVVEGKVQLFTTTRAGGGLLAFELTGTGLALRDQQALAVTNHLPALSQLSLVDVASTPQLIWTGGWSANIGGFGLLENGVIGTGFSYRRGPQGIVTAHVVAERAGATFVVSAVKETGRLEVSRLSDTGILFGTDGRDLFGAGEQMVDVRDMATVTIGSKTFILTLSNAEDAMRVWSLSDEGALRVASKLGASAGLGIAAPSALEVVQANGKSWVVAAGNGSSSISVMELSGNGVLRLTDHIIDTMETRFQRVEALATAVVKDRVFVFAGGADGGLQALMLLPDGRLISVGMIEGTAAIPIDNMTAIEAVVVDGRVELILGGERAGLLRLRFDPGDPAIEQRGGAGDDTLTGGSKDDLLSGGAGDDSLMGGAGDDVLLDGAGADTLRGNAGADVFVLGRDGEADVIRDYEPGIDRIDLSGWGRLYSAQALSVMERNGAIVIRWGSEMLTVYSADGDSLPRSLFTSAGLFGLWHVVDPDPVAGIELAPAAPDRATLTGGGGDDSLVARDIGDVLIGGSGNDLVDYADLAQGVRASLSSPAPGGGSSAGDRYSSIEHLGGTRFNDVLIGSADANHLLGRGGNDRLEGRGGKDRLYGGAGDDTLIGGPGADRLYGGAGFDIASWAGSVLAIRVDLMAGRVSGGDAANDTLVGIEGFVGGLGRDTLIGNDRANFLDGGAGNDSLSGGEGSDHLLGDSGDDTLIGGAGNDTLNGGSGVDLASYDSRHAVLLDLGKTTAQKTGGNGTDLLIGIEHVLTGWGDDSVTGSALANRLALGAGNDRGYGGDGHDTLFGGRGTDLLEGGNGDDQLWGEQDNDTLRGGSGQDRLSGDDGNDSLLGDAGYDTLYGGAGADRLFGLTEADRLYGGSGADYLSGDAGNDTLYGEADDDLLYGCTGNDLLYGGTGRGGLYGGDGNDTLVGDLIDDTLSGGTGNDLLIAGGGNNRVEGGTGFDHAVFGGASSFRVDLSKTTAQQTGMGTNTLIGIEALTTGSGHDRILGSAVANRILAGAGDDRIHGSSGADSLYGEAGRDRLSGGSGNDLLNGGTGFDVAIYRGKTPVRVTLEHGRPQQTGHGIDRLTAIEGLEGGSGSDRLTGNGGNNTLWGMAGNDTLRGFAGDDLLRGAAGNDSLLGGKGADQIFGGSGRDRLLGGDGHDTLLGGTGDDGLFGGNGNDRMLGGIGNDTLEGGAGRDRLDGRSGHDLLIGGTGADDFVFSGGHDRIRDFRPGEGDSLLLDRAVLPLLRGMSVARIIDTWGEDRGKHVALDFGARGEIEIYGIASLAALRHVIELI